MAVASLLAAKWFEHPTTIPAGDPSTSSGRSICARWYLPKCFLIRALIGVMPPRLNGDQRSDSCHYEGKPNKYYEAKVHRHPRLGANSAERTYTMRYRDFRPVAG